MFARAGEQLAAAGLEVTPGNLYLASTIGAEAAIGIIEADSDTPLGRAAGQLPEGSPVRAYATAGKAIAWANETMARVADRGPPILETLPPNKIRRLGQASQVQGVVARQAQENTAYKKALQGIADGTIAEDDIAALVEGKVITRRDLVAGPRRGSMPFRTGRREAQ